MVEVFIHRASTGLLKNPPQRVVMRSQMQYNPYTNTSYSGINHEHFQSIWDWVSEIHPPHMVKTRYFGKETNNLVFVAICVCISDEHAVHYKLRWGWDDGF